MNSRRLLLGALVSLAAACGPLLVITPAGDPGTTKDLEYDEARSRCSGGEPCACYVVGVVHGQRGDGEEARHEFDRACSGTCAAGCGDLSDAYFDGNLGATRDPALGVRYAIRACRLEASRCAAAGERFERGSGPARDVARAKSFYYEGCRRADAASCAGLDRLGGRRPAEARPPKT